MNEGIVKSDAPVTDASTAEVGESGRTVIISEIYASIQGESTRMGTPCSFVRLSGCPLRCHWCDSAYAFQGGDRLSVADVIGRVGDLGLPLVEVTGGEPLAQPGCLALLRELCDAGHEVLLETSGAEDIAPVDPRVIKVMDIKCPGSGEVKSNRWENLSHLGARDEIKFVIKDATDYDWARGVVDQHDLAASRTVLFSPVHEGLDPADLASWVLRDRLPVRLNLQIHKYLWPGRKSGI